MRLIYGGHPTWFVAGRQGGIALCPLLREPAGPWSIYPPRKLEVGAVPIQALVITEGFLPSFDLASVQAFPRTASVLLGPLVDSETERTLRSLRRPVRRLAWGEQWGWGELELRLLSALGPAGALRNQVLIRSRRDRSSVLLAGDAVADPQSEEHLSELSDLRLVVVADTTPLTVPRKMGTPLDAGELRAARSAASRLNPVFERTGQLLGQVKASRPAVIVSGGALMRETSRPEAAVPGCQEQELFEALQQLAPETSFHLAAVGDVIPAGFPEQAVTCQDGFDALDEQREAHRANQRAFFARPFAVRLQPLAPVEVDEEGADRIDAGLQSLLLPLMMSSVGQAAVSSTREGLGSHRIGFSFVSGGRDRAREWALDFNAVRFDRLEPSVRAVRLCPYGLEMFAADFLALLERRIRVEELVGAGMRAWYPDHPANSLVQFMLQRFGNRPVGALWS